MLQLKQFLDIRSNDDRFYDLDCSQLLDADERIVTCAVPTVEPAPDTPFVFGAIRINQAPIFYPLLNKWVPIGQSMQLRIKGIPLGEGDSEQTYVLRFVMATTQNPAIEATVRLRVTNTP